MNSIYDIKNVLIIFYEHWASSEHGQIVYYKGKRTIIYTSILNGEVHDYNDKSTLKRQGEEMEMPYAVIRRSRDAKKWSCLETNLDKNSDKHKELISVLKNKS